MGNDVSLLLNEELWPHIKEPEIIKRLENIANKAYSRNEEDGFISCILIKHQIIEEMMRVLITDSEYIITAYIAGPYEYSIQPLKAKMFGEIITEFKRTVEFPEKNEIISLAYKMNEYRNNIAHKILLTNSLDEIKKMARETNTIFDKLRNLFSKSHNDFIEALKTQKGELESVIEMDVRYAFYNKIDIENNPIRPKELEKRYKEWIISDEGKKTRNKIVKDWME
jgi:hypothetical protein